MTTPVAKRLPYHCLPEFFEIVNAYGAYMREKNVVKQENKKNNISLTLRNQLSMNSVDIYSYSYRELGNSDGLSNSASIEIQGTIEKILEEEKKNRTKNLISTQKYYKKLKHEFKINNPALIDIFDLALSEHQSYMENKKRAANNKHNEIIKMSARFVAFFNYNFNGGDAFRVSYNLFAKSLKNRTGDFGISHAEEELFHKKLGTYSSFVTDYKLNISEIELLASALKIFVNSINDSDTQDIERYIENKDVDDTSLAEKKVIVKKIIDKNIKRFNQLHSDYEEVVSRA